MRRGFVMITMLCCTVVLVAFLGLAVDSGYLELVKTRMQTAADAAALGGAQEIKAGGSARVVAAARADAALNGFTDGVNGVTVTVNTPPSGGYSTANSTGVEVIVAQEVPTFFMRIVGSFSARLQARAVAHLGSAPTCVYILDQTANAAFSISNGAKVEIDCGIMVESASASAFKASGGSKLTATNIAVFGGDASTNGAQISPTPVTGVPRTGDPLAYIPAPAVPACTHFNTNIPSGTVTLAPGAYCNGIVIGSSATVIFAPAGDFILKGGMSIAGGAVVSGGGTFYNTAGEGYSYAPFNFASGSKIKLTAPTSGDRAGILLFQDRGISSAAVNTLMGGTDASLNGALYFPHSSLSYSGGSSVDLYSIIVAGTISFSNGAKVRNDYSSLPSGSPARGSALVSE
jgi:hypothetical protein